jgi:hypothetical protein
MTTPTMTTDQREQLVVLHSVHKKPACKQFTRFEDKKTGKVRIQNRSYAKEHDFRVEIIPITGFHALAEALGRLIGLIYAFVIRGAPTADCNLNHTPRWKRPHKGQPATFIETARHWVLLDIDHITAPSWADVIGDPKGVVEYVIGLLPRYLHDAWFWWCFTASQGLPKDAPDAPDTLSLRLAFWSEVPLGSAELRRWAAAVNRDAGFKLVDPVLFDAIQAHYIAKPVFSNMPDPLPRRHGVRQGLDEAVVLVIPPADAKRPEIISDGGLPVGSGPRAYLNLVGHPNFREPIKSAIASHIAINGAQADCEGLKKEIRDAIQKAVEEGRRGGRDDATLERYASDEHLDDLIQALRDIQGDKPGTGKRPEPPEPPPRLDEPPPAEPEDGLEIDALPATYAELIDAFNKRYAIANEAGRAIIFEPVMDPVRQRRVLTRIKFDDLRKLYMNRRLTVIDTDPPTGEKIEVRKSFADWWLLSDRRRQYIGGVIFDPTGKATPDYWNLWSGFTVKPAPGDWSLMQDHIRRVICGGDQTLAEYLFNYIARMFQLPDRPGEVAIVLRGKRGVGKGLLLHWLRRAWGQHACHISNPKHLIGNFNAHLRDCVMLFADEAFFAGDRAHEGVLKALITEPTLAIEGKYQNLVEVVNMLHIFMSSNSDWVVPAAIDERRFCVSHVVDNRVGDHAYFAAIAAQMETGGMAALIHDMQHRDITGFEVRDIPETAALKTQKTLTLGSIERWWLAVLERGFLWKSRHGAPWFRDWCEFYTTELLTRSYLQWCTENHPRDRKSREQLGEFFNQIYQSSRPRGAHPVYEIDSIDRGELRELKDNSGRVTDPGKTLDEIAIVSLNHQRGYRVGDVDEARARFRETCNDAITGDW